MEEIRYVALQELVKVLRVGDIYNDEVIVIDAADPEMKKNSPKELPVRLEAYSAIFVCKGEVTLTMDYLPYRVTQNMVLELSDKHMLNAISVSHDAKGYYVVLSKSLFRELFTQVFTLPKDYIVYRRFTPLQKFDPKDFQMLVDIIIRLQQNIRRKDHIFYRGMIMNEVGNFVMELADISMKKMSLSKTVHRLGHNEELAMKFMQLIVKHGKEWNEVSQYSTELCVTPVYLSRAIKAVSGRTVMDWINEARVSEAKILLRCRENSIQDVSEELHFSDQSAFGKFFKKHTGMSPLEYRRNF
ncbi:AraC family transcriptional regulator [Bacteroides sp. 224]|uniref:helix-turn-helix domain-containing protein n=1 Tax=Bacteroides sp. 224 TaxID=2302936 RepID=UPI0013D21BAD|nr:helix-turn-helix domain-containing protein [Bacteroides sp. 224]NDV66601.1 AraC family transcriptional regulator [Bacteroides sp. 224]